MVSEYKKKRNESGSLVYLDFFSFLAGIKTTIDVAVEKALLNIMALSERYFVVPNIGYLTNTGVARLAGIKTTIDVAVEKALENIITLGERYFVVPNIGYLTNTGVASLAGIKTTIDVAVEKALENIMTLCERYFVVPNIGYLTNTGVASLNIIAMRERHFVVPNRRYLTNTGVASLDSFHLSLLCYHISITLNKTGEKQIEDIDATRLMPEDMFCMLSDIWINFLSEEVRKKFIIRSKSIHPEDTSALFKLLVDITNASEKTGEKPIENMGSEEKNNTLVHKEENVVKEEENMGKEKENTLVHKEENVVKEEKNMGSEEKENTLVHKEENVVKEEENMGKEKENTLVHKEENVVKEEENMGSDEREITLVHKEENVVKEEENMGEEKENTLVHKEENVVKEEEEKNAVAEECSKQESTIIKLYRNVVQNETFRMMMDIDLVVSEAMHLFGHERSQILFDLLDDELFKFVSAGAISNFVPNMAESDVRQQVISFFNYMYDMIKELRRLLISCPNSKELQQMPEKDFRSLLLSVIGSALKAETSDGKKQSSESSTFVMVNSDEFQKALGDNISGVFLDTLGQDNEMVVSRFVDPRHEEINVSVSRKNSVIYVIYFPSDCRLFLFIPTENGSYWHQADVQRANRISWLW